MHAPPSTSRPLGSDVDRLALSAVVVVACLFALGLIAGHLSALLVNRGLPRYHLADVPTVLVGIARHLDDPPVAWRTVNTGTQLPGPAMWWGTFCGLAMLGGVPLVRLRRGHGRSAHGWAPRGTTRPLRVKGRRALLAIGRARRSLVAVESQHSLLVLGPTQSGKTTSLAIPAILEWPGPVVATSTKGDLVDNTIGWRSTLGPVHVFDPAQSTAYRSSAWTPMAGSATWAGASQSAWDLAMAGKAAVGGTMSLADFWFSSAAKSLAPYLLAAAATDRTIADVARWIDAEERIEVLAIVRRVDRDAVLALEATFRREERARSSLFQVMQQILAAYLDPAVAASADGNDIDFDRLFDGGTSTLYIAAPHRDQARLRPIFSTLVRQVISGAYDRVAETGRPLDPPLLLVLDEAANIAPVEDLATIASTAAAMGLQLITVFQDLAQTKSRYGEATGTIVNNHRATLLLPGIKDVETLELAARLIGEHEVDRDSVTRGTDGRRSNTTATHWRRLLPVEDGRTLRRGSGVLVYGNLAPIRLRLRPWYRDRHLRRRGQLDCAAHLRAATAAASVQTQSQLPTGTHRTVAELARERLRRANIGRNS